MNVSSFLKVFLGYYFFVILWGYVGFELNMFFMLLGMYVLRFVCLEVYMFVCL